MIARLGNALYALGCVLAAACLLLMLGFTLAPPGPLSSTEWHEMWWAAGGNAAIAWLIGRACRYVLAGR